jgi:hypothetical protein
MHEYILAIVLTCLLYWYFNIYNINKCIVINKVINKDINKDIINLSNKLIDED